MSKNIKIELELPDFEKELTISVNLRKDGEVITTSSFPTDGIHTVLGENPVWKQTIPESEISQYDIPAPKPEKTEKTNKSKKSGGNLMNLEF